MSIPPLEAVTTREDRRSDVLETFSTTEQVRTDLGGRSFRGGVATLSGQGVNFLLQMGSTAILARILLPRDFGLLAMVMAIMGFVALFKDLGLSTATIQRAEVTHAQVSFLFWLNFGLSCCVALLVATLAPAIAWFYHEPRLLLVTLVLATNFVLGGLTVQHQALLRRRMQFLSLAVIDVTSTACGLAAGIAMALLGFGYWSLVGIRSAISLANCLQVWIRCRWRPDAFKRGVGARPMVEFGRNLTGFNVLNYFTRNFDTVLIGRVLGSAPLGIYSKAYGLLLLPIGQINLPVSGVILPGLSRLQQKPAEYKRLFLNATRGLALVTVPIVIFSLFFARDVVLILLGRRWLPAAHVFELLAPAALMGAIESVPHWLCQSLGRTDRQLRFGLLSAPITVIGFLIGVKWGIEGVAVSFSITFTVLFWQFVWSASRGTPVRFLEILKNFIAAFVPALFAGFLAFAVRWSMLKTAHPFLTLVLCGVVFTTSYIAVASLSGRTRHLVYAGVAALRPSSPLSR